MGKDRERDIHGTQCFRRGNGPWTWHQGDHRFSWDTSTEQRLLWTKPGGELLNLGYQRSLASAVAASLQTVIVHNAVTGYLDRGSRPSEGGVN